MGPSLRSLADDLAQHLAHESTVTGAQPEDRLRGHLLGRLEDQRVEPVNADLLVDGEQSFVKIGL